MGSSIRNTNQFLNLIYSVAPSIAIGLNSSLQEHTIRFLAKEIGITKDEVTYNDILDIIGLSDIETLRQLRQLEKKYRQHLADIGIDLDELVSMKRASFKAAIIKLLDPAWFITTIVILISATFILLMLTVKIPYDIDVGTIISILLGSWTTILTTMVGFHYGASMMQNRNRYGLKQMPVDKPPPAPEDLSNDNDELDADPDNGGEKKRTFAYR